MNNKEYMKNWIKDNREHIRAYDRERYAKNPEPKLKRANKRYQLNSDEIKAKRKAYYEAHKDEARASNRRRRASDPEKWKQYEFERREKILAEKAGSPRPQFCEVCGAGDVKIVYDHDHATGKFRGWICFGCNTALGHVRDNVDTLNKLINYLEMSRGSPQEIKLIKSPLQINK